jgi:hypothetical protein
MATTPFRGAASRAMLAVLAVLVIAGVGLFLSYWMQPPTKPEADVGRGVVEDFLGKVRAGQAGEAWDATTTEFKSIEGRESFIRSAAKAAALKEQLQFTSTQDVHLNEEPRAEYIFQAPDGKMVRVLVGYEGGTWKVDRLTL